MKKQLQTKVSLNPANRIGFWIVFDHDLMVIKTFDRCPSWSSLQEPQVDAINIKHLRLLLATRSNGLQPTSDGLQPSFLLLVAC